MDKKVANQFIRFVIVGVINTLVYYILYRLFLLSHVFLLAHVTAFLISALGSYFLTTYFTFQTKASWSTFIRFPITFLPNLVASTIGTQLLVSTGIINEKYASLFMMIIIIPVTFIINKLIFKKGD